MFSLQEAPQTTRSPSREVEILPPDVEDGGDIWRIAKASAELDLNSSYMYLLFARDFADTSRVVRVDGTAVAFVLAYRRADAPECLFVWQVAVDENHRGEGLARQMLDDLIRSSFENGAPIRTIETTVTDDNIPSRRLFASLADRWGAQIRTQVLFDESHFPDDHEAERLHKIGPLDPDAVSDAAAP